MTTDDLRTTLARAEERLDRRLDEQPRPHLVATAADPRTPDVFRGEGSDQPGAQHAALWFDAPDLFSTRDAIGRAIDARLAVDPYATLDVVLVAHTPFPLDLIDLVRARLARGTPSYLSRTLALRGEDLQRRITVVVPVGSRVSPDWVDAVRDAVPVFRDQSLRQAAADAAELGASLPGARVVGDGHDPNDWALLCDQAEPGAVAFADRALEIRWLHRQLGFG